MTAPDGLFAVDPTQTHRNTTKKLKIMVSESKYELLGHRKANSN